MKTLRLLLLILVLPGCSFLFGEEDLETAEEKMAVLRVSNDYLRFIALGSTPMAEGIVAWSDYGPAVEDGVTRAIFADKIVMHLKRYTPEEHPLLGLDVKDVRVRGDDAKVVLQKKNAANPIKLELRWAGRGWLIVNDNIFSKDGVYSD